MGAVRDDMQRRLRQTLGALLGAALGGGAYAIEADPVSAIALGLVGAAAGGLTVTHYHRLPGETDWEIARWNGAFAAIATTAAFFGLNSGLGISAETTLTLQVLVLLVAWCSLLVGVVLVHEQRTLEA